MSLAQLGDTFLSEIEDTFFPGNVTDDSDSMDDPFADDEFFHPHVIHDDETCKLMLHYKISGIGVKLWDVLLLLPCSIFLSFLLLGLPKARQRLRGLTNSATVSTLYVIIFMATCSSLIRCLLNMMIQLEDPSSTAEKILWLGNRLVYFTAEFSIVVICFTFEYIGRPGLRKVLIASLIASTILCGIELYFELALPYYGNKVINSGKDLYGHGGPIYWCIISALLSLLYLLAICLPSLTMKQVMIPRSPAFYGYVSAQALLNGLTSLGALLVSLHYHSGLCITNFMVFVYFSFLPVVAYICFVRPSLKLSRPNLLFSYTTQMDENHEDAVLSCSGSIQSFTEAAESTIIKQKTSRAPEAVHSTIFRAGIQSPEVEDRNLLIQ